MNPAWVIEQGMFAERQKQEMFAWCEHHDIPVHGTRMVPFEHSLIIPVEIPENEKVVCYGSVGFRKIVQEKNWKPGIWYNDWFAEEQTFMRIGDHYLNSDAKWFPLSELGLYLSDNHYDFIKPDEDTKLLIGSCINRPEFIEWYDKARTWIEGDPWFLIATPKHILREWRCLTIEGEYVVGSGYGRYTTKKDVPANVCAFATEMARLANIASVHHVDVALTAEGELKVVEMTPFYCAGTYDMDIPTVMSAVTDYVRRS